MKLFVWMTLFWVFASQAYAQMPPQAPTVENRLSALEERVLALETKLNGNAAKAAPIGGAEIKFGTRDDCIHCPLIKQTLELIGYAYDSVDDPDGEVPWVEFRGKKIVGPTPEQVADLLVNDRLPKSAMARNVVEPSILSSRPVSQTVRVVRGGGPSWTWPGNIRSHLISGHGYSPAQLQGLSHAELVQLHNNAHNGVQSRGEAYSGSTIYAGDGDNCPSGNCPTGSASGGRRLFGRVFNRRG